MASVNIDVKTDEELKAKAQAVFESIGLDLPTAVNLFLFHSVKANNLPFVLGVSGSVPPYVDRASLYGIWKGKYELPEGFDEPLEFNKETP